MQTNNRNSTADAENGSGFSRARASSRLQSLRMVSSGWGPIAFGFVLLFAFIATCFFLVCMPWRQSVAGSGEIIVLSPMNRPQTIEAQIPGRLISWDVVDGQEVKAGQRIAQLQDLDSRFMSRSQMDTLAQQKQALISKQAMIKSRVESLNSQMEDQSDSRKAALPAAEERIGQAKDRLQAAQQSVDVAEQNVKTTQWQLDRIQTLFDKGLRSQRDQQLALLDNTRSKTELQRAKSAYDVVSKDAKIAGLDLKKVSADTKASINAIKASMADANQVIAATNADIAKIDIEMQNLKERVSQREVTAPCSGRVVRLNRVGTGETVSAGTVLATIAPNTEDRAAALMVRDFDAPLVQVGDPVRLSISGWPSLQFVGWPSVAFGTFAGRVKVIDAIDDGKHYYRVIVVPDSEAIARDEGDPHKEQAWPSSQVLRPGAQASGWILLRDVPLYYELWRQFNGFQPTIVRPESEGLDRGNSHMDGLDRGIKTHGDGK